MDHYYLEKTRTAEKLMEDILILFGKNYDLKEERKVAIEEVERVKKEIKDCNNEISSISEQYGGLEELRKSLKLKEVLKSFKHYGKEGYKEYRERSIAVNVIEVDKSKIDILEYQRQKALEHYITAKRVMEKKNLKAKTMNVKK